MRPFLRSIGALLAWAALLRPGSAQAQTTPTLEFAAGVGNPTGNGPTVANQVITFQKNTNNPGGNTFAAAVPTTTATFTLDNQQFTSNTSNPPTNTGVVFGAAIATVGGNATSAPLFPLMNAIGNSTNGNYTSTPGVGGGIAITNNRAVTLFNSVQALPPNASTTARLQFADLTITFNRAVTNPVIQLTGLGNSTSAGLGYSTELDLLTPGVTLSKLSGSPELNVTPTKILNSALVLGPTTGSGAASGSVQVSSSAPVTTLLLRIYVRGDGRGTTYNPVVGQHNGDQWLIGFSSLSPNPVATPNTITRLNPGGTLPTAIPATAFAGTDAAPFALSSLTLTTFPTNATSIIINGTPYTSATFAAASPAERTLLTDANGNLAAGQSISIDPAPATGGTSVLPFTVTDDQGATSTAANLTINYVIPTVAVTGVVFEDVNYGGGAGRPYATANTSATGFTAGSIRRSGAVVELYDSNGNYVATTTTDVTGNYTFSVLPSSGYTVRVVNASVTSVRTGYTSALVPVQTYNGTATKVGGENPSRTDAAANTTNATLASLTPTAAGSTTAAESIASFTTGTGTTFTGPDFGFNFDLVVNTNDAGQGSLRQFILNSNALGGEASLAQVYTSTTGATTALATSLETSIFMIPNGAAVAGQVAGLTSGFGTTASGTAATILLTSAALPDITGPFTVLNGSTQTRSTSDSNAPSTALNAETTGPEVIIDLGYRTVAPISGPNGFSSVAIVANDVQLLNLGITNSAINSEGITVRANALRTVISSNTINNNDANITFTGSSTPNASVITNNIIRNSRGGDNDGLELNGGNSNLTITGNQFLRNAAFGIDFLGGGASTNNTITGNTFTGNGVFSGGQLSGIGLRGSGSSSNTIANNTFTGNKGAGIVAVSGTTNNVFSQNSFSGNGFKSDGTIATVGRGLAIDLTVTADQNNGANGDGVTVNDLSDTDTGANGLVNFPVLTTAAISGTELVLNGYARPGALVELYLAAPDPTSFGEGATYLTSFTQGAAVGTAGNVVTGAAGTYGPDPINGLNQGTDNTNTFRVTIPLSSLTPTQRAALQGGAAVLTSTATLAGSGTSEFSGNLALTVADVTVSLTGPTTLNAGQVTGTFTATFTNEGPGAATDMARTVTLPAGANLVQTQRDDLVARYAATFTLDPVTSAIVINFGNVALGTNAASAVTFAFTAPNAVSPTLALTANTASASQGANFAPDQATLTLSTVTTADVQVTSVTPTTTATTGKFAVVFANNGPQQAAGVAYSVQLPAGLTGVAATNGGTYDSGTGLVSYPGAINTLASGGTFASDITYTLTTVPSGPATATARVSTTTNEGGLTTNNVKSATMPAQFDLTTTLSGPAAAVAGSPTTLYVTTANLGPNTAPVAAQTVSIPSATTLAGSIYITNGGTYSYSGGVGTVSFPILANLPGGQTVTNSISFLAPAGNFAPSATVAANLGTEANLTNNVAYLNGAAGSTNVTVSTVAALSNEATTIEATTTTNGTTTPATVVDVNTPITYVVKSFNKGYSATTTPATVVEQVQLLPGLTAAMLKVGTATPTTLANGNLSYANTAGTTTYNPVSGLLTYYTVTQAAGESTTYDAITVTAPAAIGNGGQLLATASVQTNFQDPVPADNVASVAVRVRTKPDLATTVSGPSSTAAGLPATYVVRFTNGGTNDAATVTETVQLPAGLSSVSITDASGLAVTGAYNSTTGLVTFPGLTTDAVGMTQTYTLVFPAPGQNFPVTSTIAGLTSDGVATNNSATQLTTVAPSADLAVSLTGPVTAVVGNPVTYVVTTVNNGPTTATSVTPTLQLPKNLAGVVVTGSATYNSSTGVVTFATADNLTPGASTNSFVTFPMPSATATGDAAVSNGLIIATAAVSSTTADLVAANNSAALTTSVAPTTPNVADLATSISVTSDKTNPQDGTVPAGARLTYTVAYRNTAGSTATNVVGTVNLPPGLSVTDLVLNGTGTNTGDGVKGAQEGDIITFGGTQSGLPNGATYNRTTGLLTFPTFATLPVKTGSESYSIAFTAPARDVVVVSEIASATSDNGPRLNYSNLFTDISANVDIATDLSGPTSAQPGTTVTYAVTTVDNGPSPNPNSTIQTVTLPAGVTPVVGSYPGGTYSGNTITWNIPAGQAPGAANAVVNTFSLVMPATGRLDLTASISSMGETTTNPVSGGSNGTNNSATLTTNQANQAPVAENIWNTLRGARANNALDLPISPLVATDADGSLDPSSYTVTKAPTQGGTLYYNGVAVTDNTPVAASGLSFVPTPGFVGNVTFSYQATDRGGAVSPPALYTIPVAQDQAATYATTPAKGGANRYAPADVLAYVVDPNAATYTAAGLVYDATTGILLTNAANGLLPAGTNAVLANTGPAGNPANTLPAGVSLNPATGQIFVSDVSATGLVNNPTARTYSVNVTTTDANGGLTTQTVTFTIGANPLPVTLTAFTAQTVQNRDALLKWNTATEVNSAAFEVERSFDGAAYAKVGEVAAQGTTATAHAYAFTDAGIAARAQGPVYYRLRQVDLDGTAAYSPVRTVSFSKVATAALSLYPNPAAASTSLDLSALPTTGSYQVLVLDATGRQVLAATLGGGLPQPLNLTGLAAGTYQVLVTGTLADGSALRQVLRLTRE